MKRGDHVKRVGILVLALALCLSLCGCSRLPISQSASYLDTTVRVAIYDNENTFLLDTCMTHIQQREELWSRTLEDSDVSKINAAAGQPVEISADTAQLVRTAAEFTEKTDGAFDITVAPILDLWAAAQESGALPSEEALSVAAALRGTVAVDENTVTLPFPKSGIDLGGIAKGQIADELAVILKEGGSNSALIDLGGNILTVGTHPDGQPFRVGIVDPRDSQKLIGSVEASNMSVVTSGSYERGYQVGDVLYSHIVDPRTGVPVDNDLLSVTVLSPRSVEADALSTACFVMGLNEAKALIESLPDTEAVFVTAAGDIVATSGAKFTDNREQTDE